MRVIKWDTNANNCLITHANIGMLIMHYFCCCLYLIFITVCWHISISLGAVSIVLGTFKALI